MNQRDIEALREITESVNALAEKVESLNYLAEPESVKALKGIVIIAPTLSEMAEGYKAASWFGRFVKWIGGIGAAILAIIAVWQVYHGSKP